MNYEKLEDLFRMMSPGDLFGVPVTTQNGTIVVDVIKTLFDQQGGGAVSTRSLRSSLKSLLDGASDEEKRQFNDVLRIYSSEGMGVTSDEWYVSAQSLDQTELEPIGDFRNIIGARQSLSDRGKAMAIILSSSDFITPAVRKTSTAEIFLNYVPSIVLSRCVPYLNAEFVFDRQSSSNKLTTPNMLKFLLGAADTTGNGFQEGTANSTMLNGLKVSNETTSKTIMGMDMFLSPQTLTNPTQVVEGSRYVDVLDPFRPFASIEGLTINVSPTVGTFSYKRATLTLKLHDRSRLSEIADLIKPLVYSKTTVWLTYGWRHPAENNNPYASFINDNMLVREPYGIVNSGFSIDKVGQTVITLELFTKGVRELRDIRITQLSESFEDIKRQIEALSDDIGTYRQQLNLDKPTGLNKEIRSYQILESGERGEFPDIKPAEVQAAITSLQRSLNSGGLVDQDSADRLIDSLQRLYAVDGTNREQRFLFKERLERQVNTTVNALFDELSSGTDPFLMTPQLDSARLEQAGGGKPHPFVSLAEQYNKIKTTDSTTKFKKRLVSFGKIMSVFVGRGVVTIPGVDELQMFFYNFNERAGRAAGVNIAEFPIDMSVFRHQFTEHVSRYRSDHITLDEFLKLLTQAQLSDVRGVGYGFFSHFETYDPKNTEAQLKKNQEQNFENAYAAANNKKGPFKMPAIDIYVESTYATTAGKKADLLTTFERAADLELNRETDSYRRVMRIHVYDKQVNPYPIAASLLKRDDASEANAQQIRSELLSDKYKDAITKGFSGLPQDIQEKLRQDKNHGIVIEDLISNEKIKRFVSKMIPTIIYGNNGSTVISMDIASKQDPLLTSVQMMANRAGRPSVIQPNGGGTGGLPLRIIPASAAATTFGCPLIDYMQLYFLDLNTGTTLDNIYGVTGLQHMISPGKFESQMTMTFYDAYGSFESPAVLLQEIAKLKVD